MHDVGAAEQKIVVVWISPRQSKSVGGQSSTLIVYSQLMIET